MSKRLLLLLVVILISSAARSAEPDTTVTHRHWCPSTAHVQFAGFIGMLSGGAGYQYWKQRINTSLLYGYVPPRYSTRAIHTLALKNTILLYRVPVSGKAEPSVYSGFSVNCEVSGHTFITLPDYYPRKYYGSQALHMTVFAGLKVRLPLTGKTMIEPYAEIGTLDSYIYYLVRNNSIGVNDIFRAAIGINLKFR